MSAIAVARTRIDEHIKKDASVEGLMPVLLQHFLNSLIELLPAVHHAISETDTDDRVLSGPAPSGHE